MTQVDRFLSENSLDEDEEQDSETESLLLQATRAAADDAAGEHVESNADNREGSEFEVDRIDRELEFEESIAVARGKGTQTRWGEKVR